MKKYSEIALSDEEKKVLDWLKSQDYTHIGRSSNNGFIEAIDNQKGFRVNLKPMRKPFEFIENGERYRIDSLLNPPHEQKTVWDMKDGDAYWMVNTFGAIYKETWKNGFADIDCRNQGNAFLTKEEAEFEAKRREVVAKVKKYARPFIYLEPNWYPYFCRREEEIGVKCEKYIQSAIDYFSSEDDIKQAIDEVGEDDFKKYYLGVTGNA